MFIGTLVTGTSGGRRVCKYSSNRIFTGNQVTGRFTGNQVIGKFTGNKVIGKFTGNQINGKFTANQVIGKVRGSPVMGMFTGSRSHRKVYTVMSYKVARNPDHSVVYKQYNEMKVFKQPIDKNFKYSRYLKVYRYSRPTKVYKGSTHDRGNFAGRYSCQKMFTSAHAIRKFTSTHVR